MLTAEEVTAVVEGTKAAGDLTSIAVVLATLSSWLPPLTAVLSLIWVIIRIYETDTVQNLIYRRNRNDETD